jgi:tetratricopeptide (TPR) repeat protein
MRSYDAMKFFHLYYVPAIPLAGRKRFHKECSRCHAVQEINRESYAKTIETIKLNAANAILALEEGESSFAMEGGSDQPVDAVDYLVSTIDWLYASQNKDFCQHLIAQLANKKYPYAMLQGASQCSEGKLDQAIEHYQAAHRAEPNRVEPLESCGMLQWERRHFEAAAQTFKLVLARLDDPRQRLITQIRVAELQFLAKSYADSAATYAELLSQYPALANDKSFMKSVTKAKKKAGLS